MDNVILPVLDLEILKEKASEYAMKGAIEQIKEYYTGYNSPFKKAINEELQQKSVSISLDLPDVIGLINQSLNEEVTRIANNCIAQTFMPLVTNALTRIGKEVKFSEILQSFVDSCKEDFNGSHTPIIEINENSEFGWLSVKISFLNLRKKNIKYSFTLHRDYKDKSRYLLLSLPRIGDYNSTYTEKMKLSIGDAYLEMPFARDALQDKFTSYMARIVICRSLIDMDCEEFSDEMFGREY